MSTSPAGSTEVLIVGAGPTGLVLALWLTRLGVRVRIVDQTAQAGTTSRALALQARTLEFYRQFGLADEIVERGRPLIGINLWARGQRAGRVVFGDLATEISPYPYALVFPQDEHEKLLIERLRQAQVEVERQTELLGFQDDGSGIRARLKRADATEEECAAAFIAGCDGAHSRVRESLHIGFPGGTYEHLFYVADVEAAGPTIDGEAHVGLDETDFLAVFPMKATGRVRLVGTMRKVEQQGADLTWNDIGTRVIDWMHLEARRVNWFSTYHVHHRVASRFRAGRAFLLGDAGHIHSPVGGQGMNTGIGDAINLAWKLAMVVRGRADASLLDSYEPERIGFARRLVATTDLGFTGVTGSGAIVRTVRLRIVPLLLPLAFGFSGVRRLMFRTISQTALNYGRSPLSQGRAGSIRGGARLPWVKFGDGGDDNFRALETLDWQVHVYGEDAPALEAACATRKLPVHVFRWRPEMDRSGLRRDAVYLVRPDGYVAMAAAAPGADAIMAYLDSRGLLPAK
ncbi:MAG TPA: FAD-dependent monooxygenase [Candidatus Binataceae bacterium]|nr:FAD-dependent monooxygenase [Candidatus Binataceae bacterium]